MKGVSVLELLRPLTHIRITAFVLLSSSLFYLGHRYASSSSDAAAAAGYHQHSSFSLRLPETSPAAVPSPSSGNSSRLSSILNIPSLPPTQPPAIERTGIVDENGVMTTDFEVGVSEPGLDEAWEDSNPTNKQDGGVEKRWPGSSFTRFKVCGERMEEYIPCLDNAEAVEGLVSRERGEQYERHCPGEGKGLDCLVPAPKGYRSPIPWPQSRDEVWSSNVPHTRLVEDKGGQKWISIEKNKFIFPQFIRRENQYLDRISRMAPDIAFGHHTHVALNIGCGVASFGAFLLQRNVTTLSIAPKDIHESHIQFALERGIPAMVAVFATRRLLYPSQAFDLIHCSRCRINWVRDDGILLLEVNRMLRAGGYFIWAAQPLYKHEEKLQEQWKEMESLTAGICWELIKKDGYVAIWRKPLNNSCYLSRDPGSQPPLCDPNDDPDNVWYVDLKACIARLPENGYGGNITAWPARLHRPPDRLQSIAMDAYISRKEIFRAETKYWNEIIESFVNAFRWKGLKFRNVMDMRAGLGGFAAALHDLEIDSWVMNVVPVSGFNTLPVIYDRGLIGVTHDWCEPFDTYPRTYDLLHAMGLFSVERKRCNISSIMLEMDRMLRPGARAYIRDSVSIIYEVRDIASAMGWLPVVHDTGEGSYASWKILICEKH